MAEERDYELDPLAVEQSAQLINEFGNELKRQQATAEAKEVEDANEKQALLEQDDPRNAEKWGIRAVAKELQSAVTGDTRHSVFYSNISRAYDRCTLWRNGKRKRRERLLCT